MSLYANIYEQQIIKSYDLCPTFENATLHLELSNICNHKCVFCTNATLPRKKIHMEEKMVYRFLDEAAVLNVKAVGLFMNGEPFVSRNLADYAHYGKEHGIKYLYITTNGALADEYLLKRIVNYGHVDSIKFSINAGSRETYKKVHGRDDFDRVMNNLRFLSEYRKKNNAPFKLYVSSVVTDITKGEMKDFNRYIKGYVDEALIYSMANRGGTMIEEYSLHKVTGTTEYESINSDAKLPCPSLFNDICVTCEGFLSCCCYDEFNYLVTEDLHDMTLQDAWYSKRMMSMREAHLKKQVVGLQCFNCVNNVSSLVKPLRQDLVEMCTVPRIE